MFFHVGPDLFLKANYVRFPSKTSDIRWQVKKIKFDLKTSKLASLIQSDNRNFCLHSDKICFIVHENIKKSQIASMFRLALSDIKIKLNLSLYSLYCA